MGSLVSSGSLDVGGLTYSCCQGLIICVLCSITHGIRSDGPASMPPLYSGVIFITRELNKVGIIISRLEPTHPPCIVAS